ncbi:MAG: hypothetical protein R3E12_02045 [Candidatus Eisenbacteria bacterium]
MASFASLGTALTPRTPRSYRAAVSATSHSTRKTEATTRSFQGAPAMLLAILLTLLGAPGSTGIAVAQSDGAAHTHAMDAPPQNFLSPEATHILQRLLVQDYQGRTKPLDTYSLEMVMKVTKKGHYLGWRPLDMYLSWLVDGDYWTGQPLLYVHHPGTKELLSIDPSIDHVVPASLWDARGRYRMADEVETTLRTPPSERSKARTKLLSFDEEFQIFVATVRGVTLRIFPVPNDPNHAWTGPEGFSSLDPQTQQEYQGLYDKLIGGLQTRNDQLITEAAAGIHTAQVAHSTEIMPSDAQLTADRPQPSQPVRVGDVSYSLSTFMVLDLAYAWSLQAPARSRLSAATSTLPDRDGPPSGSGSGSTPMAMSCVGSSSDGFRSATLSP